MRGEPIGGGHRAPGGRPALRLAQGAAGLLWLLLALLAVALVVGGTVVTSLVHRMDRDASAQATAPSARALEQ